MFKSTSQTGQNDLSLGFESSPQKAASLCSVTAPTVAAGGTLPAESSQGQTLASNGVDCRLPSVPAGALPFKRGALVVCRDGSVLQVKSMTIKGVLTLHYIGGGFARYSHVSVVLGVQQ